MGSEPGRWREWLFQLAMSKVFLLIVGGAVGTCARYYVGRWFYFHGPSWAQSFPIGTLFINVTGSFLLGFAVIVIREGLPPEYQDLNLLFGVGFCGGYTTFSTFELDTFLLIRDGSWGLALANVLASVLVGFVGVLLGVALGYLLLPKY